MPDAIRVLHVDDDEQYGDLVATYLEHENERFEVELVRSAADALDRLERECPDCVVSDYEMPGIDGIELLQSVRETHPNLPFVLFTGKGSEEVASEAIAAGATDYLQKQSGSDRYELLANRVENAVEQYRSRHELERERSRMQFALEATDAAVWELDPKTGEMEIQPPICPLLDTTIESVEAFLDEIHPADRSRVRETVDAAARSGESYSVQFRFPDDGDVRWGEMTGRTIHEDDDVAFQTGITRDVTTLKERKRRFETLTSNLPGMAYRCLNEPEWPMEDVRGDVASFAGYTAAELETGETEWGSDVVHPDDRDWVWDEVQSSLAPGASFELTYRIVTDDDETRWVWERGRGIYGPEGELEAIEGFITDITDRKRRERRLERQNERFDRLASVISHDLRSPISTVRGRLELARETGDPDHLDDALSAVDRLEELREDLVGILHDGTIVGETEPVDVAAAATTAWEGVNHPDGSTLDPVDEPTVEGDPDAVTRLLQNLLSNAVEHADGATVVRVGACDGGFYVADDGPGIAATGREDVFTPGFSTNPDGTGMGMASVAQIVDEHGWTIDVTDADALDGARFEISVD